MIVIAGLFVAGLGSVALIIRELRKAPEGYEDEHGFCTIRQGVAEYGVPNSITRKVRRTRGFPNWLIHRMPAH
jgi:hypothetical protein